jgi:hypothetical protein
MSSILFRKDSDNLEEFEVAQRFFPVYTQRTECPPGLVLGRYSVLPFYYELSVDLSNRKCWIINSLSEHWWISKFLYYDDLKEFTPRSWTDYDFHLCEHPGPFVVKGRTNSRKWEWNKKMFAPTKRDALDIAGELAQDGLIGPQGVIYREYVPLVTYEVGLNGLPFTNEWRFFFYKGICVGHGYYWSVAENVDRELDDEGYKFAFHVASIAKDFCSFFVLDIAKTVEGKWILIEVNDGQMSGLSEIKPEILYRNLKEVLDEETQRCC